MSLKTITLIIFLLFNVCLVYAQIVQSPFADGNRFFTKQNLESYLNQVSTQLQRPLKYDFNTIQLLFNTAGNEYKNKGNLDRGVLYLKIAHDVAESIGDQEGVSVTCGGIASLYMQQGKYKKALPLCKKAIILQQKLGFEDYLATSYYNLGSIYQSLGQYEEALLECDKARKILEKQQLEYTLSRTYNLIGLIYNDLGLYEEALFWCDKSRVIRNRLNFEQELSESYNAIGFIHHSEGDQEEALIWYFKAKDIQEKLQDKVSLAHTYNNIGAAYKYQGLFDKALIWCQKSRTIVEQSGDKVLISRAYNNIGIIYNAKEEYTEALFWYEKAQKIREEMNLEVDLAISYNNLAGLYEHLEQYDKAESFCKKAISIQEKLDLEVDLSISCNMMGYIYNEQEQYELAILWYSRTKNIREKLKLEAGLSYAYNNLASVYRSLGLFKESLFNINKARHIQEKLSLNVNLAITYNNLANIYYELNELDSTLHFAQLSISLHEQLRNLNRGQTDRQLYLDKSQPALGFGVASAYKLTKYSAAFELSEKAKARGLTDLLAEKAIQLEKLPDGIDTVYESVINRLNAINQSISDNIPKAKRKNLLESRSQLYKEKKNLEDQIKTIAPAYANLNYPETITSTQAQSILKDNEVLINYFTGRKNTYAFIITSSALQMLDLGSTDSLKTLVNQYRFNLLENQRNAIGRADLMQKNLVKQQFFNISSQLYQKLWPSIKATGLLKGKDVILVPDGFLNYLPFELLIEDQTIKDYEYYNFLIKEHSIRYYPSATVIHFERINKRTKNTPSQDFLGIAVSNFQNNYCYENNNQTFTPLPLNEDEVESIASQFTRTLILKGENTKESTLKGIDLDLYRYLHFSTHGLINTETPDFSRILLSPSDTEDGCLNLYEIFDLELNADLVTLSACETGLGKLVRGEGIVGFTRALMYAGVTYQ